MLLTGDAFVALSCGVIQSMHGYRAAVHLLRVSLGPHPFILAFR